MKRNIKKYQGGGGPFKATPVKEDAEDVIVPSTHSPYKPNFVPLTRRTQNYLKNRREVVGAPEDLHAIPNLKHTPQIDNTQLNRAESTNVVKPSIIKKMAANEAKEKARQKMVDDGNNMVIPTMSNPGPPLTEYERHRTKLHKWANPLQFYGDVEGDNFLTGALEIINPYSWGDHGFKSYDSFKEGDIVGGFTNAIGAIPLIPVAAATGVVAKSLAKGVIKSTAGKMVGNKVKTILAKKVVGNVAVKDIVRGAFAVDAVYNASKLPEQISRGENMEAALTVGMGLLDLAGIKVAKLKGGANVDDFMNAVNKTGKYLTEKTALKNAYKLNPKAFKPNSESAYRMIGDEAGYLDAINSGEIRAKIGSSYGDAHFNIGVPLNPNRLTPDELIKIGSPGGYEGPYMVERRWAENAWNKRRMTDAFKDSPEMLEDLTKMGKHNDVWGKYGNLKTDDIAVRFYKEDWLRGYKQIDVPNTPTALPGGANGFKSEINWGKWNKEIPMNKPLMKEYGEIEAKAIAEGNWMRYSDGSTFKGSPEQFVQMKSKGAAKYAGGYDKAELMYKNSMYRGANRFRNTFNHSKPTFLTSSKANAQTYTGIDSPVFYSPDTHVLGDGSKGLYELGVPPGVKRISTDAKGKSWKLLDYNKVIDDGTILPGFTSNHKENLAWLNSIGKGPKGYDKTKKYLSTDVYSNFVKNPKNKEVMAEIRNVKDQMGSRADIPDNTVFAVNGKKVNMKSLRNNNGMFDMNNPNIYKFAKGVKTPPTKFKQFKTKWNNKIAPIRYKNTIKKIQDQHFENYNTRFKSAEGERRLGELGLDSDYIIRNKPALTFNPGKGSHYASSNNSINIDPTQIGLIKRKYGLSPGGVYEHEVGHLIQRAATNISPKYIDEMKKFHGTINDVQESLGVDNATFRKMYSDGVDMGIPTHPKAVQPIKFDGALARIKVKNGVSVSKVDPKFSKVNRNYRYFKSRDATNARSLEEIGVERYAHLRETRQGMVDRGIIPDIYSPITEGHVSKYLAKYGNKDRMGSFTAPSPANIRILTKVMNNAPVSTGIIGLGGYKALQENRQTSPQASPTFKQGGSIESRALILKNRLNK